MRRLLCASFVLLALASCKKGAAPSEAAVTGPLASYVVSTPPAGAQPVAAVRQSAKSGDEVVVQGRAKDFIAGRALVTIVDPSKKACDESGPMDTCPTPWDFCCNPPEEINAVSATVEIRDASGVIKQGLQGVRGLDHLDTVIVAGTAQKDESGNLTVVAKNVYVAKRPPLPPKKN